MAKKHGPKCHYTVEPGRSIYRNDRPFIDIGVDGAKIVDADAVTHVIAAALNRSGKCNFSPYARGLTGAKTRKRRRK